MRLTNSQRQAHIKAWQQSALSRKQYCLKQNIGYSTFCKWIQNCQVSFSNTGSSANFIKLPQQQSTSARLSILLPNGIEIDCQAELTTSLLQQLQNVRT